MVKYTFEILASYLKLQTCNALKLTLPNMWSNIDFPSISGNILECTMDFDQETPDISLHHYIMEKMSLYGSTNSVAIVMTPYYKTCNWMKFA